MYIEIDWIMLLVRAVVAVVMIYYGWPKIRDLESNANDFVHMGFKPGMFWGTLIAVVEFFGGIAILVGVYAELAAALFAFQMMVGTFWKLKVKKPFSDYSYDIQLFALCLVIMSTGAGSFAVQTFPGVIFLRWDVALVSLAAALLMAGLSRPDSKRTAEMAGGLAGADNVLASVRVGYERSRRMIADIKSQVAALRNKALVEIREDLQRLAQKLDRLAERAERELKEFQSELSWSLIQAEVGLRLAVDDVKAHLKVIEAKRELVLARMAALRNDLVEAEARVESALRDLEEAQSLALGHEESLAGLQKQAQEMLVAIRSKASTMKAMLNELIERNNRLLAEMSGHPSAERTAA